MNHLNTRKLKTNYVETQIGGTDLPLPFENLD